MGVGIESEIEAVLRASGKEMGAYDIMEAIRKIRWAGSNGFLKKLIKPDGFWAMMIYQPGPASFYPAKDRLLEAAKLKVRREPPPPGFKHHRHLYSLV